MPAGWHETARWPQNEAAVDELPNGQAWHDPPVWEHVPPPQNGGGYAQSAEFGAPAAHAYWGGDAPGWPEPDPQAYTEHAAPSPAPPLLLLSLAPIPAGWNGRSARRDEPAARPTQFAAEPEGLSRDVLSKLLASLALAPDVKLPPPSEPPATAPAVRRESTAAASAPREAAHVAVAPQQAAVAEPPLPGPVAPQPGPQLDNRTAAWPEPVPQQELSDDSSDAGTSSDGADDFRDAPAAGASACKPAGALRAHMSRRLSDASERIADLGQNRGEAALSAPASMQPAGEASKATAAFAHSSGGGAAAPALALPAPPPPYAVPALPPAAPAPLLPPFADAGPQSGLGALLAARRETETVRATFSCWCCLRLNHSTAGCTRRCRTTARIYDRRFSSVVLVLSPRQIQTSKGPAPCWLPCGWA